MKWLTLLLFLVYFIQADVINFLGNSAPVFSPFHPVLALADFAIGFAVELRAWPLTKESESKGQPAP